MKYKTVIFDLDGTLLDTLEDLADSFNYALSLKGFRTHPAEAYRLFIGDGARMAVQRALHPSNRSDFIIEQVLQAFTLHYAENYHNKTKPYPGIHLLLNNLKSKKLKLAVLSNKPHDFTVQCADFYFRNQFDIVLGHDTRFPKKPNPQAVRFILDELDSGTAETLYIGDTKTDMETAKNAELVSVGVTWGFREERELRESGANYIVNHALEILNFCTA